MRPWPATATSCGLRPLSKLEAQGQSIRLPQELWGDASAEQKKRAVEDPWLHTLEAHLDGLEGKIRAEDIWRLLGMADPKTRSQHHNSRLGEAMRSLGWQRKQFRFGGRKVWAYWKGPDPLPGLYVHQDGTWPQEWKVSYDPEPSL